MLSCLVLSFGFIFSLFKQYCRDSAKNENEVGHPFERGSGLGPTIYSVASQSAQVRGHDFKRLLTMTMMIIMIMIMIIIIII